MKGDKEMVHTEVYKQFKTLFPENGEKNILYFPNGKNSIRIRTFGKPDMIFTFKNTVMWKLETIDSFLDNENKKGT